MVASREVVDLQRSKVRQHVNTQGGGGVILYVRLFHISCTVVESYTGLVTYCSGVIYWVSDVL